MKYKILGFVIILIIVTGVFLYFQRPNLARKLAPVVSVENNRAIVSGTPVISETVSSTVSPTPNQTPELSVSGTEDETEPPQRTKTLIIEADDFGAGLYSSKVKRGTRVNLTFRVMSDNVFSGGLEFRSPLISTGPILRGQSKTITFVIKESLVFIPYGVSPQTQKPYSIRLNVID